MLSSSLLLIEQGDPYPDSLFREVVCLVGRTVIDICYESMVSTALSILILASLLLFETCEPSFCSSMLNASAISVTSEGSSPPEFEESVLVLLDSIILLYVL